MIKEAQYPEDKELNLSEKTLLHLLNLHGFSKEPGLISLNIKDINLITYYSGSELGYYIVLVLSLLENAEDFEEKFEIIALNILKNLNKNKYNEMLSDLFKNLSFNHDTNKNN